MTCPRLESGRPSVVLRCAALLGYLGVWHLSVGKKSVLRGKVEARISHFQPCILLELPSIIFLQVFCFDIKHLQNRFVKAVISAQVGSRAVGLAVPKPGCTLPTSGKGKTNETFLTGQKCVNC